MQLPRAKNEVNVNTIITVIGFLLTIAGGGAVWGTMTSAVNSLSNDQAKIDARITGTEVQVNRIPNLEYRMTVQEQINTNTARAVDELRQALSDQGADIKVMREILTRLDRQMTQDAARGQ